MVETNVYLLRSRVCDIFDTCLARSNWSEQSTARSPAPCTDLRHDLYILSISFTDFTDTGDTNTSDQPLTTPDGKTNRQVKAAESQEQCCGVLTLGSKNTQSVL